MAATTKGLRMASAWVRMGELAKQMRDILSAAPDMEAAAAKANDLLELFSSREGTDAAGDEGARPGSDPLLQLLTPLLVCRCQNDE